MNREVHVRFCEGPGCNSLGLLTATCARDYRDSGGVAMETPANAGVFVCIPWGLSPPRGQVAAPKPYGRVTANRVRRAKAALSSG